MRRFLRKFPKVKKTGLKITGFSAHFRVVLSDSAKKLNGVLIERGHLLSGKEGPCNESQCKEYHCQSWNPPRGAVLIELACENRDSYYLLLFKNGREVFLTKQGENGCAHLNICKLDQINKKLFEKIEKAFA